MHEVHKNAYSGDRISLYMTHHVSGYFAAHTSNFIMNILLLFVTFV
jgi:hypothetical protein